MAKKILQEPRFHRREPPRPLHGVLQAIGNAALTILRPIGRVLLAVVRPVGRLLAKLAGPLRPLGRLFRTVFGPRWPWVVAALAVVLAALVTSIRVSRRSAAAAIAGRTRSRRVGRQSPDDLEREAERAERAGELDRALRLRFEAGVIRLGDAGVIVYRPSLTSGEVVQAVRSAPLRSLAVAHDEVAYGGRAASADDMAQSRTEWPKVLAEAGRV